jgi:hypothetical protein
MASWDCPGGFFNEQEGTLEKSVLLDTVGSDKVGSTKSEETEKCEDFFTHFL